jgi:hypothetical protein
MLSSQSRSVLMIVAFAAMVYACGGDRGSDMAGGDTSQPALLMANSPRALILSPAEGDSVSGDSVRVAMAVEGAAIVPATTPRMAGQGHLHLFLDRDVTPDGVIIPVDSGIVHFGTGATEHTYVAMQPGPHRIIVVFAFSDHVGDNTVATDTVNFVVRPR